MEARLRYSRALVLLVSLLVGCATGVGAQNNYPLSPDSQQQPGVPEGEVTHYSWTSKVFPGTVRDYWVYVPKQYDPATPTCVMVCQDGGGFQDRRGGYRLPVVFDNLIAKKQMPVTIAIMINPGVVPAANPNSLPRFNRSYEYDNLGDEYARFLETEILPEVGKKYNLTKDPNGRAICGSSSGGICAFTAAWERPDLFCRVISFIGSFTNLRGGHNYPSWIRKSEPKPIRIFMQDGSNDQDIYSGSWPIGNNDIAAALKFAGYDYQYVVGTGSHSGAHGAAIFPDALRWIWRDYPSPIKTPAAAAQPIMQIVQPGEEWREINTKQPIGGLVGCRDGTVLGVSKTGHDVLSVYPDTLNRGLGWSRAGASFPRQEDRSSATYFTVNGELVWTDARNPSGVHGTMTHASSAASCFEGWVYYADTKTGRLARMDMPGRKPTVISDSPAVTGLTFSPDHSLLYVSTGAPGKFIHCYQVMPDGSLANGQAYFDVQLPYASVNSGAGAMVVDTEGRLYAATAIGIQVFDQAGRVNGILNGPGQKPVESLAWGGAAHDTLVATSGGKVYIRKVKSNGVLPSDPPTKPAAPRL